MTEIDPDARVRTLAAESLAEGDPTGWFERLYAEAESGTAAVPWDSRAPHPLLVEWAGPGGGRALVVGCGLGDDAEHVATLGYDTVAFDVAQSAVRAARERFPASPVHYVAADLLDPPAAWPRAFDLVVEIMTVQALPDPPRGAAIAAVADLVAPGGTLLVIAMAAVDGFAPPAPPWPLTRAEVDAFATGGLVAESVESLAGPLPRWRAVFRRPA